MIIIKDIKTGNVYSFKQDELIAFPSIGETIDITNEHSTIRGKVCCITHQIERINEVKHDIIIFVY